MIDSALTQSLSRTETRLCRLGILRKKEKENWLVEWKQFSSEEDARNAIAMMTSKPSMVLFGSNGIGNGHNKEHILFLNVLQSNIDVAMILHAHAQSINRNNDGVISESKVNKTEVQNLVSAGELPTVPKNSASVNQWVLKRAMELTFSRKSIQYFSCGPLRNTSLYYYDVKKYPGVLGHVALTIDDAPCRFSRANSRVIEVVEMLKSFEAKATFMVIGKFIDNGHSEDLIELLEKGNELANHGMLDRPYHSDTQEEFLKAVDSCNDRIRSLQKKS